MGTRPGPSPTACWPGPTELDPSRHRPPGPVSAVTPVQHGVPYLGRGGIRVGFETTFTVFTPTFDRASTLGRVYESLKAQTLDDFEWLIVDDGSTDGTGELVASWQRAASFPIRYLYQENAGKHVAFNRGVREARGALFLSLDSDDACVPDALERLLSWWDAIPADRREGFSAVTALCRDQHGELVGTPFPESPLDCSSIEMRWVHRVEGEKWGFQRTDVLRRHPFPEPPGVRYVSESLVWRAIDQQGYQTRFVNEPLRIYWVDEAGKPSLTNVSPVVLHGRLLVHQQTLNELGRWFTRRPEAFAAAALNVSRYGLQLGMPLPAILGSVRPRWGKLLVLALLPLGAVAASRDRRRHGG